MKIVEDVRATLNEIDNHYSGKADKIDFELFRIAYRRSSYLFSKDILDYLKGIDEKIISLEHIESNLIKATPNSEQEKILEKKKDDIIVWLREQKLNHESKFTEFMTLNKI